MAAKPIYLTFDFVSKRRVGISDLSRTWVVAKWIARGTGTVLYKSKQCGALKLEDAKDQAKALAYVWLIKQNERPSRSQNILAAEEWTGPRYVDITGQS